MEKVFTPLIHGFSFQNSFPGIPFLVRKNSIMNELIHLLFFRKNSYGLCGGMCFAALDYFYADKELPYIESPPEAGDFLHSYIFKRQNSTYGRFGKFISKFIFWSLVSDIELQSKTYKEFSDIRLSLDKKQPVVIGLVYVHLSQSLAIWSNHQVIAHSYEVDSGKSTVYLYDPNFPGREDIALELIRTEQGFQCIQRDLQSNVGIPVRGFFKIPYRFVPPPEI
jgi:hypothetical protein